MLNETYEIQKDEASKYVYLHPKKGHDTTLIFLHGVQNCAENQIDMFLNNGIVPETCRVVLPNAPMAKVTMYGEVCTSWLDMYALGVDRNRKEEVEADFNQEDAMASALLVLNLVDLEKQKFEDQNISRIYLAGFSQGCMITLAAYLMHQGPSPLGGVIGLGGNQVLDVSKIDGNQEDMTLLRKSTPLFLYHGEADDIVKIKNAEMTYQIFKDIH